jgi:hypothetical protein
MAMFTLNIADCLLEIKFNQVKEKMAEEAMNPFLPFLHNHGRRPDEILEVVFIRSRKSVPVKLKWESLIKECVEKPFKKFPFVHSYPSNGSNLFKMIGPYLQNENFNQFLEQMINPKELIVFIIPHGLLLKDKGRAHSCLLLKPAISRQKPLRSMSPAVYFLIAQILPEFNSIMLHGVGIRRKGQELLFLGGPGNGKSTLAKLLDQGDIISDDAIIVKQNDSRLSLQPSPFNQNSNSNSSRSYMHFPRSSKELIAGFFLEKSENNFLTRVSPAEAGSIILKNHIHFFRYFPETTVHKAFHLIGQLCKRISFYRLYFKKDSSFWPDIDNILDQDLKTKGGQS